MPSCMPRYPAMTASLPLRYRPSLVALHWLTLLLLIAVYACIELREFVPRGTNLRRSLKDWHFALGLVVPRFAAALCGANRELADVMQQPGKGAQISCLVHLHLAFSGLALAW